MKCTETVDNGTLRSGVLFKFGSLRFDSHGTAGILSVIVILYALITLKAYEQIVPHISSSEDNDEVLPSSSSQVRLPVWLLSSIVCTSLKCSIGSYRLLPQSPISTPIFFSMFVPPHRDAFERTVAIIGYLNLRLLHEMECFHFLLSAIERSVNVHRTNIVEEYVEQQHHHQGVAGLLFPIAIFLYVQYHFLPRKLNLKNGNTYVFVLPMWIVFTAEAIHQFPSYSTEISASFPSNVSWNKVDTWNAEVVDVSYLLTTMLSALFLAFMFTLSFRGIVGIYSTYFIAVAVVMLLSARVMVG